MHFMESHSPNRIQIVIHQHREASITHFVFVCGRNALNFPAEIFARSNVKKAAALARLLNQLETSTFESLLISGEVLTNLDFELVNLPRAKSPAMHLSRRRDSGKCRRFRCESLQVDEVAQAEAGHLGVRHAAPPA